MSKKLPLILALLSAGATTIGQLDSSSKSLDPVIITANKISQKQSSTGKVVTVITNEQIERSQGKTISQLLNETSGITVNGALNNFGTNQSLFLRGASGGRTLILVDGIPVYDPSLINNEFDLNLISLNNVECIEVCRGAQSSIYGSDALAGVINIITAKQIQNKPIQLRVSGSAGNFSTHRGSIDLSGKNKKLSYSFKYSGFFTKGFSSAFDSTYNKAFDRDGFSSNALNSLIKYQFTTSVSLKAFAQYSGTRTDLDAAAFSDEKDYWFKNKALITGSGLQFNKGNVRLTANYQYSVNRRNYLNDSADAPGFTKFSKDRYIGKSHFIDIYSRIDLADRLILLQGADYRYSAMNSSYFSLSSFGPYNNEFKDTAHSLASLYGSLFYNGPDKKLNTDLGFRLNVHSQYGTNWTFTFNPSYNFNQHYRLLSSIASAFKAPTLYQLYSAYGNRSLEPEKSITYDLGFEQKHHNFSSRIIYFHRQVKQGIDFNYVSYKYFNIAEQSVKGIELEAKVVPLKNVSVNLNYSYLHAEVNSQSRISFKDTVYHYELRRPKHNLNITTSYDFENGLHISVSGKYVNKRYDIGGYQVADVLLKSYFLLNAYAEYGFQERVKIFVDFQNITGKRFFDIQGYNSIPFLFNTGFTLSL
jgi:vitamin B12 transporter